MPGLLGKKIGMTSVFSAEGKNLPCTVIEVGPCVVTQIKTLEKDGYEAVQLGFQEKKEKHTTQPEMGHFKKAGVAPQRHLAEFKNFETEYKLGDVIDFLLQVQLEHVPHRNNLLHRNYQDLFQPSLLPIHSHLSRQFFWFLHMFRL